ncbi:hypothetical protein VNO77_20335 [Canavalia gladiata]|uniref:RHOMBOID-like protein n=1 Tax=Canavalia gladiata TaxID=3824 RepID=A0AAN9LPX5_CANGL
MIKEMESVQLNHKGKTCELGSEMQMDVTQSKHHILWYGARVTSGCVNTVMPNQTEAHFMQHYGSSPSRYLKEAWKAILFATPAPTFPHSCVSLYMSSNPQDKDSISRTQSIQMSIGAITSSLILFFVLHFQPGHETLVFFFSLSLHGSLSMEGEPAPSEVQLRVNSRQWSKVVHPMEIDAPLSSKAKAKVEYREMKQFKKWVPWLIPFFVIVNVLVFIITMYVNDCPKRSFSCIASFLGRFSFQPFNENPLLGPALFTLQNMGALDMHKVVYGHQGWRLITCMWLHGGVLHLLANMFGILVVGIRLEQEFGFVLIGLLFVISGFGGSLLSALFIEGRISVGASGALFGLLGGMLSELITNWSLYEKKLGALFTLVFVIVINLAVGILPHVDNFAHIGGFLSGFLLGFVFLIRPQFGWIKQRNAPGSYSPTLIKPKFSKYQCFFWVLALVLLILGFTSGLVAILHGVDANDHCSWCHYLSCVPTSRWNCNQKVLSCVTELIDNHLNMTCSNNGKSSTYYMPNPTNSKIYELCSQICS